MVFHGGVSFLALSTQCSVSVLCVPCLGLSLVRKVLFYDLVKDLNSAETGVLPCLYLQPKDLVF